jgi:hypothetical protein
VTGEKIKYSGEERRGEERRGEEGRLAIVFVFVFKASLTSVSYQQLTLHFNPSVFSRLSYAVTAINAEL